jgi:hypothetical protein
MTTLNLQLPGGITLVCTKLNRNTKQAERVIHMYEYTRKGNSIYTAYGKPSDKKVDAFNEIKSEMERVKGFNMRITGAGSDVFSCAYQVKDGSDITYLIYHTPSNRFVIEYKVPDWIDANRR